MKSLLFTLLLTTGVASADLITTSSGSACSLPPPGVNPAYSGYSGFGSPVLTIASSSFIRDQAPAGSCSQTVSGQFYVGGPDRPAFMEVFNVLSNLPFRGGGASYEITGFVNGSCLGVCVGRIPFAITTHDPFDVSVFSFASGSGGSAGVEINIRIFVYDMVSSFNNTPHQERRDLIIYPDATLGVAQLPTPEPSTFGIAALGLGMLAWRKANPKP